MMQNAMAKSDFRATVTHFVSIFAFLRFFEKSWFDNSALCRPQEVILLPGHFLFGCNTVLMTRCHMDEEKHIKTIKKHTRNRTQSKN